MCGSRIYGSAAVFISVCSKPGGISLWLKQSLRKPAESGRDFSNIFSGFICAVSLIFPVYCIIMKNTIRIDLWQKEGSFTYGGNSGTKHHTRSDCR